MKTAGHAFPDGLIPGFHEKISSPFHPHRLYLLGGSFIRHEIDEKIGRELLSAATSQIRGSDRCLDKNDHPFNPIRYSARE
jgi:hypothetical protein